MYLLKDITKLFNRPEPLILCNELGENIEISDGVSNSFFGAIVKSPVLGRFLTKRFLYDGSLDQRFILNNSFIDTSTIKVYIGKENTRGIEYCLSENIFNVDKSYVVTTIFGIAPNIGNI